MSLSILSIRLDLDPAMTGIPLVTLIAEATSIVIHLSIAKSILSMPDVTGRVIWPAGVLYRRTIITFCQKCQSSDVL